MSERSGVKAASFEGVERTPTIEELEEKLISARREAAKIDYKYAGRIVRTNMSTYEQQVLSDYESLRIEYGKKVLAGKLARAATSRGKNVTIAQYFVDERAALNREINNPTQQSLMERARRIGRTAVGSIGSWLSSGSKKRQFVKGAAVGVLVGAVAGATVGAGTIAAVAVAAGARLTRGYARNIVKEANEKQASRSELLEEIGDFKSVDSAFSRASSILQVERKRNIDAAQERNQVALDRGFKSMVLGAALGGFVSSLWFDGDVADATTSASGSTEIVGTYDTSAMAHLSPDYDTNGTVELPADYETAGTVELPDEYDTAG
ncbi:MAG: hypothetical protein EOM03_15450, partial [Clostridia bacterium]|nr:hypothetical protein [Clostridia bacterium]